MRKAYFSLLFAIYILAVVVCCGSRGYLTITGGIDIVTGLYNGNGGLITIFNTVLLVAPVLWFVMTILRRTGHEYPLRFRNTAISFFGVVTGLSILVCTAANVLEFQWRILYGIIPAPNISTYLAAPLTRQMFIMFCIRVCFGVLAALGMILLSVKRNIGKAAFVGIFPALWLLAVVLDRYVFYMAPTQISENLLAILFMTFASVFLLSQARAICGFHRQGSRNILVPAGLTTSLIGFSYSLPKITALILNNAIPATPWDLAFMMCSLVLAIYSLLFVKCYIGAIKIV